MALDVLGKEIAETCENCEGLYDDSDGPEYGPPSLRCNRKPHMENLKGFPFKTPQKCFDLHWSHLIDWDAEAPRCCGRGNRETGCVDCQNTSGVKGGYVETFRTPESKPE